MLLKLLWLYLNVSVVCLFGWLFVKKLCCKLLRVIDLGIFFGVFILLILVLLMLFVKVVEKLLLYKLVWYEVIILIFLVVELIEFEK